MIIAEGFKPRRQGLCPPSQPPAAVLSSSPPVAVKKISITIIISIVRSKQDDHGLKKSASQSSALPS